LIDLPLFGNVRAQRLHDQHTVLLDGESASVAFASGDHKELLKREEPLSWSWSANLARTLIVDRKADKLFVRRWDNPDDIEEHPLPSSRGAARILESIAASDPPSTPTVVERMTGFFRIIRSNINDLGGTATDVIHTFNAALVGADAVKNGLL